MKSVEERSQRPVGSRDVCSAWAIFAFLFAALILVEVFDSAIGEVIEVIVELR